MVNVYDFDKTIYDGDSSIDFYVYCLKMKKSIILLLPVQIFGMFLYLLKIKSKEYYKEKFFTFVKKIDNIDKCIEQFWNKNIYKIKPWYKKVHNENDVIISASPEFLLKPLEEKLKIHVIASKVDKKTGKFLSKNCYGNEKVIRFKNEMNNQRINKFYTDSLSDKPLIDIADEAFIINKSEISKFK